ncbi:hypothetical protein GMDG_06845 [Pseudogymnoascus destructans 20631-21]|uniref:Uncharacterized protein n=1 Tax=Pseudogymnoascus destructans (strain ATCC MYA-4855 / 20631-21) TaxID=658429 RepID=L8FUB2_PSED2|nr:hypothetical protein GMDG_06845 [Pseudogymnoascus destructans 20631-21]
MPIPTPAGALLGEFHVLCLRCLRAKARGIKDHDCVWSPASSKCEYCTAQHSTCVPLPWFLDEEYRVLAAAEAADPWDPVTVEAAAAEANWVALVAAQSVPKFRSAAERDSYEELHATLTALEAGLAFSKSGHHCAVFGRSRGACRLFWGKWWLPWAGLLPSLSLRRFWTMLGGGRRGVVGVVRGMGDGFGAQYGAEEDVV